MAKYLIFSALMCMRLVANADISCAPSPADVEPLVHRVLVEYFEDGETFAVFVKAPPVLRGLDFRGFSLIKGDDGDRLIISLASKLEGDFYVAGFYLHPDIMRGTTLNVGYAKYDHSCPSVIKIQLDPKS